MKKVLVAIVITVLAATALPAIAAAPDGTGPWADTVINYTPGLQKDGNPVVQNDPTQALGIAEATDADGTYVSLGFGGEITLGFENPICNGAGDDLQLIEVTREPFPDELVDVYVSDGGPFVLIASAVNKDATVPLPAGTTFVNAVRLVDVTDPNAHTGAANAYDVDGVQGLNSVDCALAKISGGIDGQGSGGKGGGKAQPTHAFDFSVLGATDGIPSGTLGVTYHVPDQGHCSISPDGDSTASLVGSDYNATDWAMVCDNGDTSEDVDFLLRDRSAAPPRGAIAIDVEPGTTYDVGTLASPKLLDRGNVLVPFTP